MRINNYVKRWCYEEYDIRDEDFFLKEAYWGANENWFKGTLIHGALTLALVVAHIIFAEKDSGFILNAMLLITVLTASFLSFAIRKYDANEWDSCWIDSIITFIVLVFGLQYLPSTILWILGIVGTAAYIYFTFIRSIHFMGVKLDLKKMIKDVEAREEEEDKAFYEQWEADYKAYRQGLPVFEETEKDPYMEKVRALFEGYTDSKEALKARYRTLAKKEHPDNGGDAKMFQCIVDVYEELRNKMGTV